MKTTKTVMIAFLLLGISAGVFAQTQFAVGIKAGPNFANLDTDASASTNMIIGQALMLEHFY